VRAQARYHPVCSSENGGAEGNLPRWLSYKSRLQRAACLSSLKLSIAPKATGPQSALLQAEFPDTIIVSDLRVKIVIEDVITLLTHANTFLHSRPLIPSVISDSDRIVGEGEGGYDAAEGSSDPPLQAQVYDFLEIATALCQSSTAKQVSKTVVKVPATVEFSQVKSRPNFDRSSPGLLPK